MHIHTSHKRNSGFSLLELLIAMFLGLIVVGMIIYIFSGQRKGFITQKAREESQESVSRIHGELLDKIRMAGYMVPESVDAIVPFHVTDGPDSIRVTGNYDNFITTTSYATVDSSTWVIVKYNDRFRHRPQMHLYIKEIKKDSVREEWEVVDTSYIFSWSGNTHIVFFLEDKLGAAYPVGSRVSVFSSYTFKIKEDNNGEPYCAFTLNGIDRDYILVEGIEDMTLTYETRGDTTDRVTFPAESLEYIYSVNIEVESRAQTPDYEYEHPVYDDHYRRETLKSEVVVLNNSIERR